MKFIVETSARHVHVTQEDLETLFGKGYELTKKKDLSQPGQFACNEKVKIVGTKKEMMASILGPVRPETQIELSLTDARSIGVVAPIRESGDVAGSGACKLVGPAGEVEVKEGVIAAKRHIHATPEDAENFVQTMRQFEGEYDLTLGSVTVDAKSILGVFALGIGKEFELLFVNPREEREDVLNAVKNYRIAA